MPAWGSAYLMRLHGAIFDPADADTLTEDPVRGEAVIYLVDEQTLPGALGYHDLNSRAIPVGFVFVLDTDDWTVTLSHEALELIIDPTVNIFVPGPDPRDINNLVLHTYEVCDAVERTTYSIDGVVVSNFVTSAYFTISDEPGTRNDFLGVGVPSFGVTPGSHLAFFDLSTGSFVTVFGRADPQASRAAKAMAASADKADHAKPTRPADAKLQPILDEYNKKPGAKSAMRDRSGLQYLRGISRTGRYEVAAQHMATRKGYKLNGQPAMPTSVAQAP